MGLKDNLNVLEKTKKSTKLFLFQQRKEITKIDKEGNGRVETISYRIKFIDSARFKASSLSNILDNLTEEIH